MANKLLPVDVLFISYGPVSTIQVLGNTGKIRSNPGHTINFNWYIEKGYITCIVLEVIVHWIVLVLSPQFEMQFFVPGHEPVYINNQAPFYFQCHLILFKHEPPNHGCRERTSHGVNECIHRYIIAHCNFSSIWTLRATVRRYRPSSGKS